MEDNWYETVISAFDGDRILSVVDWTSDSPMPLYLPIDTNLPHLRSEPKWNRPKPKPTEPGPIYYVFPWGTNDPQEGNRTTVIESKTADKLASPNGWHSIPLANLPSGLVSFAPLPIPDKDQIANFSTTIGNNVFAQENWEGLNRFVTNYRPDAGHSLNFTYPYNPQDKGTIDERMKEAKKHINATVTQLFYTTNMFHDLLYRYVPYPFHSILSYAKQIWFQ
jgi:extracellular elastinolytic metalloproteinase